MDTPTIVTRDRQLEEMTKSSLVEMILDREIAPGISESKLKKTSKEDLVQMILEWEQKERLQSSAISHESVRSMAAGGASGQPKQTDSNHVPWSLRSQTKKYDPHTPSKDAFRLKRLPTNRNLGALVNWCKSHNFDDPQFSVDGQGLVLATSDGNRYDLWSNGGSYFATKK